jgi:diaminopimelate epimerase
MAARSPLANFVKMHGAGNDFVILDAREGDLDLSPARIMALADRRRGIGCDQLILLHPPRHPGAAVAMRIFNPDGSPSDVCGNATRCVASLVAAEQGQTQLGIETPAGLLQADCLADGRVRVDMGAPRLGWQDIPLTRPCDTLHLALPQDAAAVSMGNPHATLFTHALEDADIASLGPALERHDLFPHGANIGFARIEAPDRIRLRVWERGAGLTLACGSGACAALVNAHRRGLAGRAARLVLDGGELDILWQPSGSGPSGEGPDEGPDAEGHVLMTGPVATSFQGRVDLSTYPP